MLELRELVERVALHFGIPPPRVRVGCYGCPFYDPARGVCSLGYVACYDPVTKTITISSPEYVREEVILHELLHYVVDNADVIASSRVGLDSSLRPYLVPGPGGEGVAAGGVGGSPAAPRAAGLALVLIDALGLVLRLAGVV